MKNLPTYIGICDFMTQNQVLDMIKVIKHYEHTGIKLMVGTMTSYKVLNNIDSKWTAIYPKPENLKEIFGIRDKNTINCIHYADYESRPYLAKTLQEVVMHCGKGLGAIQLDVVWPDPKELRSFIKENPIPLILQINKHSMSLCGDDPVSVAKKIAREYEGLISHVLLDCSMGKNIPINVHTIETYITGIKMYAPDIEIAITGGLGPHSVSKVKELIQDYRVSIDAQSGLRTSGKAADPIDWHLAEKYLHKAIGYYS